MRDKASGAAETIGGGVVGLPVHDASLVHASASGEMVLHPGEFVPLVHARLRIGNDLSDEAITTSLAAITTRSGARERWKIGFSSAPGAWLASRGSDLNAALNVVMAQLPKLRS